MPRAETEAPPTLTILGASARGAAQSAVRSGWQVVAGDLFGDVDLRAIAQATTVPTYPAGLAAICSGEQAGSWIYTGGLENYPDLINAWSQLRPLCGNAGESLRAVRDPVRWANILREAGLPAPRTVLLRSQADDKSRWLLKARKSSGGIGISQWDKSLSSKFNPTEMYLQEWIAGPSCSVVFVANRQRAVLLGVTEQLIGTPWLNCKAFRYAGSIGPFELSPAQQEQATSIGEVLTQAFSLVGLFGVDFVLHQSELWPVDINPRYPASVEILERADGFNAISLHMEACQKGLLPQHDRPSIPANFHGKGIVFAEHKTVIREELVTAILAENAESQFAKYADIPCAGSSIAAGHPILTLFVSGETSADVVSHLKESVNKLRERLSES